MKDKPFAIGVVAFLAYALFSDGIVERYGSEGFWTATLILVAVIFACWQWDEAGKEDKHG